MLQSYIYKRHVMTLWSFAKNNLIPFSDRWKKYYTICKIYFVLNIIFNRIILNFEVLHKVDDISGILLSY